MAIHSSVPLKSSLWFVGVMLAVPQEVLARSSTPSHQGIGLKPLDWAVILTYGIGMLVVGWYFSKRTRTAEDYLLGGRSMRSGPVGLSLFATLLSTITYLALPGEMIKYGPVILWSIISIPIAYVVVGYMLIPVFMRLRITSAYEILEERLGLQVRLIGAVIFLMTRLLWMSLIIYLTAQKIVVVMMGWDESVGPWVMVVIGLVTVVYTSMGGFRAVVFTDVIQSFVLLGGAILSIVLITVKMGGLSWWPTEWSPNWGHQPFFDFDPHVRVTVVGSIVFMTVWWICTAGSDQMAIQRYLATRDVKTARRAFLVTGLSNVVVTFCLASLGFALLGFFRANPGLLAPGMSIDQASTADIVFPYFIVRFLPAGITGLVIAGLLAAAMSSLSSGINSSCSVISEDFIKRIWKRPQRSQSHPSKGAMHTAPPAPDELQRAEDSTQHTSDVRQNRIIAIMSGLVAICLSVFMGKVPGNIMEVTVRTNHVFVAPLFGLFFMALFVRFATPFGTACGALAGCLVAVVIAYWDIITGDPSTRLSFQWISLVSLFVNLAVALPISWISSRTGTSRSGPPD